MNAPKISLILPVFNGERYLEQAVDSVLAQDYGDFEFLICDDASSDRSGGMIGSRKDRRIRLFGNIKNLGLFKTLNRLIRESTGEYIQLWAQDDIMKRNCLGEEVAFYEKHPDVGFCYCARDIIDGSGKVILPFSRDMTPDVIAPELAAQIMFYHGSIAGSISNVVIRRAVLDEMGLFREDMRLAADFDMWIRISEKYPIGFIRQPLVMIRSHAGQLSRQKESGLLFMREDAENISALARRLPDETKGHAVLYNRRDRLVRYAHYLIRSFLSGDIKTAVEVYREIKEEGSPLRAFVLWFFTINGRFFKKKPVFAHIPGRKN